MGEGVGHGEVIPSEKNDDLDNDVEMDNDEYDYLGGGNEGDEGNEEEDEEESSGSESGDSASSDESGSDLGADDGEGDDCEDGGYANF